MGRDWTFNHEYSIPGIDEEDFISGIMDARSLGNVQSRAFDTTNNPHQVEVVISNLQNEARQGVPWNESTYKKHLPKLPSEAQDKLRDLYNAELPDSNETDDFLIGS